MDRVDERMEQAFREWRGVAPSEDLATRFDRRLSVARQLEAAFAQWKPVASEHADEFETRAEAQRELDAAFESLSVRPSSDLLDRFSAKLIRRRARRGVPLAFAALVIAFFVAIAPRAPQRPPVREASVPEVRDLSMPGSVYHESRLAEHARRMERASQILDRPTPDAIRALWPLREEAIQIIVGRLGRATEAERRRDLDLLADLEAARELYRFAVRDGWSSRAALEGLARIDSEEARGWFDKAALNIRLQEEFFAAAGRWPNETLFRWASERLEDPRVRSLALEAVQRFNDPRSVSTLVGLLIDSSETPTGFKRRVISVLGSLRRREAVSALIDSMKDPELLQPAYRALKEITDQDFGTNPDRWSRQLIHSGG